MVDTATLPDSFRTEYKWDWLPEDERFFCAILSIRCLPAKERPERIQVAIAGKFRRDGNPERPTFIDFVMLNATTMLMPYAREAFADLSGRGVTGRFTLPTLNVFHLVSGMKFELSGGAGQLLVRPDLADAYGIPEEVMSRIENAARTNNHT